jgi:hypothetical protein
MKNGAQAPTSPSAKVKGPGRQKLLAPSFQGSNPLFPKLARETVDTWQVKNTKRRRLCPPNVAAISTTDFLNTQVTPLLWPEALKVRTKSLYMGHGALRATDKVAHHRVCRTQRRSPCSARNSRCLLGCPIITRPSRDQDALGFLLLTGISP